MSYLVSYFDEYGDEIIVGLYTSSEEACEAVCKVYKEEGKRSFKGFPIYITNIYSS